MERSRQRRSSRSQWSRVTHRFDLDGVADVPTTPAVVLWPGHSAESSDESPPRDADEELAQCSWALVFGCRDVVSVVGPEATPRAEHDARTEVRLRPLRSFPIDHEMDGYQPACITSVEAVTDPNSPGVGLHTPTRAWVLVGTSLGTVLLVDLEIPCVIARFGEDSSVFAKVQESRENPGQPLKRAMKPLEINTIRTIFGTTLFVTLQNNGVAHVWDWNLSHQLSRVSTETSRQALYRQGSPISCPSPSDSPQRRVEQVDVQLDQRHVAAGTFYNAAPVLVLVDNAGLGVSAVFSGPQYPKKGSSDDSLPGDAAVLIGTRGSLVSLFSIPPDESGPCIAVWQELPVVSYGAVLSCAWLNEGLIAVGGEDDSLTLVRASAGVPRRSSVTRVSLPGHNSYITSIVRLDEGDKPRKMAIVSASLDGKVMGWIAPTANFSGREWLQRETWTSCTLLRKPVEAFRSVTNFPRRLETCQRRSLIVSSVSNRGVYIIRKIEILE